MNTRKHDIDKIENDIQKGVISKERGNALLKVIYKQSKDVALEDRRKKMIEDQDEDSKHYKMLRQNPGKLSEKEQRMAVEHFMENPEDF